MSKEAADLGSTKCVCGQVIAFPQYHWPHCTANPNNLTGSAKVAIESKFTKSELATIATHGPMRDKPVRKMGGVGKRKPMNGGKKRQ